MNDQAPHTHSFPAHLLGLPIGCRNRFRLFSRRPVGQGAGNLLYGLLALATGQFGRLPALPRLFQLQ